jgi:hypothetical protein
MARGVEFGIADVLSGTNRIHSGVRRERGEEERGADDHNEPRRKTSLIWFSKISNDCLTVVPVNDIIH